MQRLEVSGAVRPIYGSLGVKRITINILDRRKRTSITYSECVSVVLVIQQAMRHVISNLACKDLQKFLPPLSHKRRDLRKRDNEDKMCVF